MYCTVLCDFVLIFTCLIAISQILYFHSVDFEICGFQSLHYTYPFIPNVLQTSFVNDSALIGANDTDINPKKVNNGYGVRTGDTKAYISEPPCFLSLVSIS